MRKPIVYDAVVFDMDGVIFDSKRAAYFSFNPVIFHLCMTIQGSRDSDNINPY